MSGTPNFFGPSYFEAALELFLPHYVKQRHLHNFFFCLLYYMYLERFTFHETSWLGPKNQNVRSKINLFKGKPICIICESIHLHFVKNWQNLTFKVNFICQIIQICPDFFLFRIKVQKHVFVRIIFFKSSIFVPLYFLKPCLIFNERSYIDRI